MDGFGSTSGIKDKVIQKPVNTYIAMGNFSKRQTDGIFLIFPRK